VYMNNSLTGTDNFDISDIVSKAVAQQIFVCIEEENGYKTRDIQIPSQREAIIDRYLEAHEIWKTNHPNHLSWGYLPSAPSLDDDNLSPDENKRVELKGRKNEQSQYSTKNTVITREYIKSLPLKRKTPSERLTGNDVNKKRTRKRRRVDDVQ
jgi:hypothetical protein